MAVGGLDLARRSDHSALVRLSADGPRLVVTHALRLPQVDYAAQIEALAPAVGDLARLAVDATGVGDPVVEMLRSALPAVALVPVVIGGGEAARLGGRRAVARPEGGSRRAPPRGDGARPPSPSIRARRAATTSGRNWLPPPHPARPPGVDGGRRGPRRPSHGARAGLVRIGADTGKGVEW